MTVNVLESYRNFQCDFNNAYACGYQSSIIGTLQWTLATSIVAEGTAINPNLTAIGKYIGENFCKIHSVFLCPLCLLPCYS
jgi:hypothetical protein